MTVEIRSPDEDEFEAACRATYASFSDEPSEDDVTLDVADDFCEWNQRRFRAGADAGPTDDDAEEF